MDLSDTACIARCLNGQPEEYRRLVERYQAPLQQWLVSRLQSPTAAEDASQETLVRAYFGLAGFKPTRPFFHWLCGIAHRVAAEQQRIDRRYQQRIRAVGEIMGSQVETAAGQPDDEMLRRAIARLPSSYEQMVLLRYYGQMSCAQVAEHFGVPLGTVTKGLSRSHSMLREFLQNQGDMSQRNRKVCP